MDGTFLVPDAMTVEEMLYKWLPIQSSKHKWAPKTYTHIGSHDAESCRALSRQEADSEGFSTYDLEQFYATLSRTPLRTV